MMIDLDLDPEDVSYETTPARLRMMRILAVGLGFLLVMILVFALAG